MIRRLCLLLPLILLLLAEAVAIADQPDSACLARCDRITGSVSPAA